MLPAPAPPPTPAHGESWVIDPTMAELEYHTQDAILFAQANEETVDARAVLISAWNECVESSHLLWLATVLIGHSNCGIFAQII